MKKIDQINKIIYVLIYTALTMLIFLVRIEQIDVSFYQEYGKLYQFYQEIWLSIKSFDTVYLTLGIFIYYTYYHIYFDGTKLTKKSFYNIIISVILTFITIIGKSYKYDNTLGTIFNTPAQIVKCISLSLGYYLAFYALFKKLSSVTIEYKNKKKSPFWEKVTKIFNKYQILIAVIIIILGWLPYIIFYFPAASTGDTFDSLSQFFHQDNSWSIDTINLINEDVYINKHHPPLFTVVIGLIYKIGEYFGAFTIGAFIYTVLQIILLLIIFNYMLHYMKKNKLPLWTRIASILFLSLTPIIASYAILSIKDTPSAIFTLLYVIFLLQIVRNYDSIFKKKKRILALIIIMLLVMMLRNNGIYTIVLSFPFLLFIYKNKWKKILLTLTICLSIFGVYDKVLLPALDVTEGSIKEALTIPFMQLARVVYFNPEDFSQEEQEIINKVLDFDAMKKEYYPMLADSIKDKYNKDTTKEELKDFFKLWFKYFKKYPIVYIESVINSTYGYFFPEVEDSYPTLAVDARVGEDTYIDIKPIEKYSENREICVLFNKILLLLPITRIFTHVAFYDWYLIFSCLYIIKNKKYKYLIPMLPLLSVLLVCIASPINGSSRYILPIIFSAPIIFTTTYFVWGGKEKCKI